MNLQETYNKSRVSDSRWIYTRILPRL